MGFGCWNTKPNWCKRDTDLSERENGLRPDLVEEVLVLHRIQQRGHHPVVLEVLPKCIHRHELERDVALQARLVAPRPCALLHRNVGQQVALAVKAHPHNRAVAAVSGGTAVVVGRDERGTQQERRGEGVAQQPNEG